MIYIYRIYTGLYTGYIQDIYRVYTGYIQDIYKIYTVLVSKDLHMDLQFTI